MKQQNTNNKEFTENITPVAPVNTKEKYYLTTVYDDVIDGDDGNLELVAARYILRNVKTNEMKEVSKEDLANFEIVSNDDKDDIDDEFTITTDDRYVDVEMSSFSNVFDTEDVSNFINNIDTLTEIESQESETDIKESIDLTNKKAFDKLHKAFYNTTVYESNS